MAIEHYFGGGEHSDVNGENARQGEVAQHPSLESHAVSASARARLRPLALESDALAEDTFDFAALWSDLVCGNWRFRDVFSTPDRLFAVLEATTSDSVRPIAARLCQVLARYLMGESQKRLSIELQLSPSAVTGRIQGALKQMGLCCSGSRAPVLLTVAAHARLVATAARGRRSQLTLEDQPPLWVVSVPRPDLDFPARLSSAEAAVVCEQVAGRSHAEIARLRNTSLRTVANQLAAAFRKLRVSGRGELVARLVAHCSSARTTRRARSGLASRVARVSLEAGAGLNLSLAPNEFSQPPGPASSPSRALAVAAGLGASLA